MPSLSWQWSTLLGAVAAGSGAALTGRVKGRGPAIWLVLGVGSLARHGSQRALMRRDSLKWSESPGAEMSAPRRPLQRHRGVMKFGNDKYEQEAQATADDRQRVW